MSSHGSCLLPHSIKVLGSSHAQEWTNEVSSHMLTCCSASCLPDSNCADSVLYFFAQCGEGPKARLMRPCLWSQGCYRLCSPLFSPGPLEHKLYRSTWLTGWRLPLPPRTVRSWIAGSISQWSCAGHWHSALSLSVLSSVEMTVFTPCMLNPSPYEDEVLLVQEQSHLSELSIPGS